MRKPARVGITKFTNAPYPRKCSNMRRITQTMKGQKKKPRFEPSPTTRKAPQSPFARPAIAVQISLAVESLCTAPTIVNPRLASASWAIAIIQVPTCNEELSVENEKDLDIGAGEALVTLIAK